MQASLIAVVVREFGIGEVLIPALPKVYSTSSEHVFKNLVHTLCLTICLWMISGAEVESGTQGFVQAFPESGSELGSSVRHDLFGYSVKTDNLGYVQLC